MWGNATGAEQGMVMTEWERKAEAKRKEKREAAERKRALERAEKSNEHKGCNSYHGAVYINKITCNLCGAEYAHTLMRAGTVPCPYCYDEYARSEEKYLGKVELWGKANRLSHLFSAGKITVDEFREGTKAVNEEYAEFCQSRLKLEPTNDQPRRPFLE